MIGFRPFVEACIDAEEKGEALKYITKLADPRERAEVCLCLKYLHVVHKISILSSIKILDRLLVVLVIIFKVLYIFL